MLIPATVTYVTAWLVCGLPWRWAMLMVLVGVLMCAALLVARRRGKSIDPTLRLVLVAASVCLLAAALVAGVRTHAVQSGPMAALAKQTAFVRVEAVVTNDPIALRPFVRGVELFDDRYRVEVRVERLAARGHTWQLRSPVLAIAEGQVWRELAVGDRIKTAGVLRSPESLGRFAAVLHPSADPVRIHGPPWHLAAADGLRSGLRASVDGLAAGPAGLVPALSVGDTSVLPTQLADDMRATGLTHLAAVSGANVAIVVGAVILIARWVRLAQPHTALVAAFACAGFVLLARPEPSVVRAAVMGLLALLALGRGQGRSRSTRRSALMALSTTVLLVLLVDPFLSRAFGFVLSVLATLALVTMAPRWTCAWSRRVPRPVAAAVAVPLAAQLVTAPVVTLLDPRLSLVAVPANILVAPAVAPVTLLGVLATVLSPVCPPLAELAATLATGFAWWIAEVAHRGADLSWATLRVPAGGIGVLTTTVAVLAVVVLAVVLPTTRVVSAGLRRHRRLCVAGAVILLGSWVLAVPLRGGGDNWPPVGWLAVFCDVGQGDATVLAAGPGTAVVVDVGPDPDRIDRCLDDLDVQRVEVLVLSHFHADHTEGLPGLLDGRSVQMAHISPVAEPAEQATRVLGVLENARVPVAVAQPGESHQVGEVRWRVLWPARVIREGSVPNNASVVMAVEIDGVDVLLLGDVESAAQRALLARGDIAADVAKVPHHGSADFVVDLPSAVGAAIAVVSTGLGNPYGHPTAEALSAWTRSGASVVRTDRFGDVAILSTAGGPVAVARDG
jgi:competence protein ComEC